MAREGDEMPGLVGIVSLIPAMRAAIKHRDWYEVDDCVNASGTVAISRVNLGIINKEKQPYSARGGRVKVFLHGEICNDEVADSGPLEFIYRQYEENDGRAMYFGPEMKSLLLVPALKRKLNLAAVADFSANGHFTREHTLFALNSIYREA
jgi:hypothetical protein